MAAPGSYTTARPITPGTPVSSGSGVGISGPSSAAGFVGLVMDDGSVFPAYFPGGQTYILDNVAVKGVDVASTTASGFKAAVLG